MDNPRPPLKPDFDPKINAVKALKTGAFTGIAAAATAFLTAAGVVPYLVSLVPVGSIPPPLAQIVVTTAIAAVLKSIENWTRNRNV